MSPAPVTRSIERRSEDRQVLREYYNTNETYLEDLLEHDEVYHQPLLELVGRYLYPGARLLELGCGPAISTRLLQERGYRPIGSDLSMLFLRKARLENRELDLLGADALSIPIASESLDGVVGFEFIEHVTDVSSVLTECIRVLKPGGFLLIHSPNLCSPFFPLLDIFSLLRGRPGRPVFAENLGMAVRWLAQCVGVSIDKLLRSRPQFLYRKPKPEEHIGGDADSAYLACQIDLSKFLLRNHMIVHQICHAQSRPSRIVAKLVPSMAPFIGLAAQKPE